MKTLYIVRHAKSSWDYPHLSDFDRPLNKRGKRDVPDMGERLSKAGILPSLIVSSPANRAINAAKGIAEKIGYPLNKIIEDQNIYHAGTGNLKRIIAGTPNQYDSLMIFGHNPGFTWLINDLCDFYLDNLPTCAICGIEFDISSWSDIKNQKGRKVFYDYPKSRVL